MKICGYYYYYIFFYFFFWGGGGGGKGSLRNRSIFFSFFFFWGGGAFLYISGLLRSRFRMGIYFRAAKFQIFFGMPDIPDFFLGGGEQ